MLIIDFVVLGLVSLGVCVRWLAGKTYSKCYSLLFE